MDSNSSIKNRHEKCTHAIISNLYLKAGIDEKGTNSGCLSSKKILQIYLLKKPELKI